MRVKQKGCVQCYIRTSEVRVMKGKQKRIWITACAALTWAMCAHTVWAAGGHWEYRDENNQWFYLNEKGEKTTGRKELDGEVYFFDESGVMLTGWVLCPKDEMPEPYAGVMDGEDIYYCGLDGKMAKGWVEAYNPEQVVWDEAQQFQEIQNGGYQKSRYYFSEKGKPYQNEKKTIDGKRYIFGSECAVLTGWIYDQGEGQSERYLSMDVDGSASDKELGKANPGNLLYGTNDGGVLATNQWVDAIPLWDEADDDSRSFYADSSSYIVTGSGTKGNGASPVARRKARKIDEIGTYSLEDWSTDVNITKIGGKFYCLEDSGTRIDGMFWLSGAKGDSSFSDGIYCFTDNSAMRTGAVMEENIKDDVSDGYVYYYYFAERTNSRHAKGQGFTGVHAGRLYYLGLAVGAQNESYEVVYLPMLEEKDRSGGSTGCFLVDETGRVMKGSKNGSHYTAADGTEYKVTKAGDLNDEYGYKIELCDGEKDENNHKVWRNLTEKDYTYICWDIVEE